jgi:hypothetical protein
VRHVSGDVTREERLRPEAPVVVVEVEAVGVEAAGRAIPPDDVVGVVDPERRRPPLVLRGGAMRCGIARARERIFVLG